MLTTATQTSMLLPIEEIASKLSLLPSEYEPIGAYGAKLNLTLLGKQIGKNVDLSFSVDNLLNKRYSDPAAQQHLQNAIQQDGRNLRGKLVWTFGGK